VDADADPVRAAELLARLGDHRRVAADEVGVLAAFERAERLMTGAPASAEHTRVLSRHARALTMSLQNQRAIPYCEEAIAVARAVGAKAEEAHALTILGVCLKDLGELGRSIALHLEARRIAEQVGDAEAIVRTYGNLSHALELAGRDREALDDARAGFQRARELGQERALGSYVANNLALSLLNSGHWAECERLTGELLAGDSWDASGRRVVPGGPASTLGTYSSNCSRPSKVRLATISRATSGYPS
jgi:tetratricopeptide (TPR) repeat protein